VPLPPAEVGDVLNRPKHQYQSTPVASSLVILQVALPGS